MHRFSRRLAGATCAGALRLAALPLPASANDWQYAGTIYLRCDRQRRRRRAGQDQGLGAECFGAYNLYATEQARLDVLLGARYLDLEVDFDLGLAAGQYNVPRSFSRKGGTWDAVAGFNGRLNLDERWYIPYYADIGTGESDLTWQLFGGIGYSFDWGEVSLVYRHLEWDFGSDSKIDNINCSGPAAAVTWRF